MVKFFFAGEGYGDLTAVGIRVLLYGHGYAIASFDRNQLRMNDGAPTCKPPAPKGCYPSPDSVQRLYPAFTWGTVAIWAWGAGRVVDFLMTDSVIASLFDPSKFMTMGHSRGGKNTLW